MKISKQTRAMMKSRAENKLRVLERDNYTCLVCGFKGDGKSLDAEHIIGRTSKLDDVREACGTCCSYYGRCDFHKLKTDGKAKWRASILPEECITFIEKRKWPMWSGVDWDRK